MKKITIFLLFITSFAFSQVGINTDTPDDSSILDVVSTDKGILIPRVPLQSVNDDATISAPATGLLVYKTGGATSMTDGFYYWDGSKWIPLRANSSDFWSPNGNEVATDAFIGTTNNEPLIIKINNVIAGRIKVNGGLDLGEGANSSEDGIALGNGAQSWNSTYGMSIGRYSQTVGMAAIAVGVQAASTGKNATAFGHLANANGEEALAMGGGAEATGLSAVAVGPYTKATKEKSFALGPNSEATAKNSFALGIGAIADVENTVIIGEVRKGEVDATPLLVGIGTKEPRARLDVNGRFVFGQKGSVTRNLISFTHTFSSDVTIATDASVILTIDIPSNTQPFTFNASITPTLSEYFPDDVDISWVKMVGTSQVKIKLKNDGNAALTIPTGQAIHFTIVEFD